MTRLRTNNNRLGFVIDTTLNISNRVYFWKDTYTDQEMVKYIGLSQKKAQKEKRKIIKIFNNPLIAIHKGICNQADNMNYAPVTSNFPRRVQLFYNTKEPFYSLVTAYRMPKDECQYPAKELRYFVSLEVAKVKRPLLYVSNFETHKFTGTWDINHIDKGPLVDFEDPETANIYSNVADMEILPDSFMNGIELSPLCFIKPEKRTEPEDDDESGDENANPGDTENNAKDDSTNGKGGAA